MYRQGGLECQWGKGVVGAEVSKWELGDDAPGNDLEQRAFEIFRSEDVVGCAAIASGLEQGTTQVGE
jgi:hypothetical protein